MASNISDQFASELMAHSIDLERFSTYERETLLRVFRDVEAQLVAQLKRFDPTDVATRYQRQRVEALLAYVRPIIRENYAGIQRTHARDLKALALQEAPGMQALGAELVVDTLFSIGVPEATLRALVDDLVIAGKPLRRWWSQQAQTTLTRYGDAVRAGVLKGDSINDIVRTVRGTRERSYEDGVFGRSRRDITTLTRTSVQSVAQESRLATLQANSDVVQGWEWLTALDAQVCVRCAPYSGQAWTLDGRRLQGTRLPYPGPPPLHPNCVPADTLVAPIGSVAATLKRWYDGDLIIMKTTLGHQLAITPDHPILTAYGWIAAKHVKIGDDVVCRRSREGVAFSEPNNNDVPTLTEDIPIALLTSLRVSPRKMTIPGIDFDSQWSDGEVNIINPDGELWHSGDALCHKGTLQDHFICPNARMWKYSRRGNRLCSFGSISEGSFHAPNSGMSAGHQLFPLLDCHLLCSVIHRFASSSGLYASFSQSCHDTSSGNSIFLCECFDRHTCMEIFHDCGNGQIPFDPSTFDPSFFQSIANRMDTDIIAVSKHGDGIAHTVCVRNLFIRQMMSLPSRDDSRSTESIAHGLDAHSILSRELGCWNPGQILFDEIVSVHSQSFHGYVYNMETSKHAYIANNILIKNCRCQVLVIIKEYKNLVSSKGPRFEAEVTAMPQGTKDALDGGLGVDLSLPVWLKAQPDATQRQILGPTRHALWQQGKLSLTAMVNTATGRPLTLDQLKARRRRVA